MEILDYSGLSHYKDKMVAWLDETKITRTELAFVSKMFKWLNERMDGQKFDVDDDAGTAYALTVPAGAKAVSVNKIGGHSEKSKNLLDPSLTVDGAFSSESQFENENWYGDPGVYRTFRIKNLPAGQYTFSFNAEFTPYQIRIYKNHTMINTAITDKKYTFTTSETSDFGIAVRKSDSSPFLDSEFTAQIEAGSTETPYEPYFSGIKSASVTDVVSKDSSDTTLGTLTIPPQLLTDHPLHSAGTVYDEYDFNEMEFVQRVGTVDLGTLTWIKQVNGSTVAWYANVNGAKGNATIYGDTALIAGYRYAPNGVFLDGDMTQRFGGTSTNINIRNDAYSGYTPSEVREALTGVVMFYELATPVETDISSYFTSDLAPIAAESGGAVTFEQTDTEFAVPYDIDLAIKLSEVSI